MSLSSLSLFLDSKDIEMNDLKDIKFSDLDLLSIGNTVAMSGTIWSGEGRSIICLFPDQKLEKEVVLLKMNLDEWKKLIRQSDLLETEILERGPKGITKAIVRKSQRVIDQRVMWKVFERDHYLCRYCGRTGIPLTVDHIVLWEDGGPTIEENLVTSCKNCNKARGRTFYSKWLRSDYYRRVSQNLPEITKAQNATLIDELEKIEKVKHIRSR